jgi:hypothetical protein
LKQLSEIYSDLEQYFKRPLTDEEKDYCWILQRTGAWGFPSTYNHTDEGYDNEHGTETLRVPTREKGAAGDLRYIAHPGNIIDWQLIHEKYANSFVGIILCPERKGPELCAAQFIRRGIKRVWMSIEQAESCIKRMVSGESLLTAVAMVVGVAAVDAIMAT